LQIHKAASEAESTIAVLSKSCLDALYTHPEWASAFAQDPISNSGALLPVRVGDCELTGLLAQIVYVDLVGSNEAEAKEKLLAAISHKRAKPVDPPSFPSGEHSTTKRPSFPSSSGRIDSKVTASQIPRRIYKEKSEQIQKMLKWLRILTGVELAAIIILAYISVFHSDKIPEWEISIFGVTAKGKYRVI